MPTLKWSTVKEKVQSAKERTASACRRGASSVWKNKFLVLTYVIGAGIMAVTGTFSVKGCIERRAQLAAQKKREKQEYKDMVGGYLGHLRKNCSKKNATPPRMGCITREEMANRKEQAKNYERLGRLDDAIRVHVSYGNLQTAFELKKSSKCNKGCRRRADRRLNAWSRAQELFYAGLGKKKEPIKIKLKPKPRRPPETKGTSDATEMELKPEVIERSKNTKKGKKN